MTQWAWILVAFVAGALVGAGASWWFRRQRPNEVRLRRLHSVLDRFNGEVAQHFEESAELITRLRTDVEHLYQHLESGAASLTTEEAVQNRLRQLEQDDGNGRTTGQH